MLGPEWLHGLHEYEHGRSSVNHLERLDVATADERQFKTTTIELGRV